MSLPVVAIVGRPNVGKSRLFNRLAAVRKAVVDDQWGVTRDRLYHEAEMIGRRVMVVDTGGIEPDNDTDLLKAMRAQSLVAIEEADVILFVVDGQNGFTPPDMDVADLLRRAEKPVLLVVNKIDGPRHEELAAEFWQVGIEPLLPVSAEHGRGIYELIEAIVERLPESAEDEATGHGGSDLDAEDEEEDPEAEDLAPDHGPIRIAVIGRPNIGKSTLINRLLGEERHVVHDSPGTTMDPVDSELVVGDRRYVLVDTAGVRRRNKIDTQLERFVSLRSIRMIERCHVSLLMIDATEGITDQDARIAELVASRGRALILLFNKWDLVKDLEDVNSYSLEEDVARKLPHATWAPRLFIAAKTGKGTHRILPMVDEVYVNFDRRVSTPELNRFLERAVDAHAPPQHHHHPVRLYFGTQARVRPPTFVFFTNTPEAIAPSYERYLANRLRETWDFTGSPLRVRFRRRRKLGEEKEG